MPRVEERLRFVRSAILSACGPKRGARHNGGLGSGSGGGYGTQLRFGAGDATSPYGEEPTRTDRPGAAARAGVTWHPPGTRPLLILSHQSRSYEYPLVRP